MLLVEAVEGGEAGRSECGSSRWLRSGEQRMIRNTDVRSCSFSVFFLLILLHVQLDQQYGVPSALTWIYQLMMLIHCQHMKAMRSSRLDTPAW